MGNGHGLEAMFSESKRRSKTASIPYRWDNACCGQVTKGERAYLRRRLCVVAAKLFLLVLRSIHVICNTETLAPSHPQLEAHGTADGDRAPRPARRHSAKQHHRYQEGGRGVKAIRAQHRVLCPRSFVVTSTGGDVMNVSIPTLSPSDVEADCSTQCAPAWPQPSGASANSLSSRAR